MLHSELHTKKFHIFLWAEIKISSCASGLSGSLKIRLPWFLFWKEAPELVTSEGGHQRPSAVIHALNFKWCHYHLFCCQVNVASTLTTNHFRFQSTWSAKQKVRIDRCYQICKNAAAAVAQFVRRPKLRFLKEVQHNLIPGHGIGVRENNPSQTICGSGR